MLDRFEKEIAARPVGTFHFLQGMIGRVDFAQMRISKGIADLVALVIQYIKTQHVFALEQDFADHSFTFLPGGRAFTSIPVVNMSLG